MRVAVVDIGSAVLALSLATVGDEGAISLLGEWAVETDLATDFAGAGQEKVLAGLKSFRHLLRMQSPDTKLRVYASSGLPAGPERDAFLKTAQQILDHPVEIMPPEEEAALSFLGSHDALAVPPGSAVIIAEIDGTATHICVGDGEKLLDVFSLGLGANSLTQRFLSGEDRAAAGLALSEHLDQLLNVDAVRALVGDRPFHVVVAGPTITVFSALVAGRSPERGPLHGATLDLETVFEWYQQLMDTPGPELPDRLGVPAARARTLVAGVGILAFLMEKLGAGEVIVSDNARRHGALREMLGLQRHFL